MKTREFLKRMIPDHLCSAFLGVAIVIAAIATLATLAIPIHYNHWIGGWSRSLFWSITVVIYVLAFSCFDDIVKTSPSDLWTYSRNLIVIFILLIAEVWIAGYNIHILTPCWDVKSGKLERCHTNRWDNPFERTSVLLKDVPDKFNWIDIEIFPGSRAVVDLRAGIRPGTSVYLLRERQYVGTLTTVGGDKRWLSRIVSYGVDRAFLGSGITTDEIDRGTVTNAQKDKFLSLWRQEITKRLPEYLYTKGVEITLQTE